jgi:hypothetical protein
MITPMITPMISPMTNRMDRNNPTRAMAGRI